MEQGMPRIGTKRTTTPRKVLKYAHFYNNPPTAFLRQFNYLTNIRPHSFAQVRRSQVGPMSDTSIKILFSSIL